MNLFGMMELSGGAMSAERMRAEVVAANMANAETTRTEAGTPYKRQHVVFASGQTEQLVNGDRAGGSFAQAMSAAGTLPAIAPMGLQNAAPGVKIAGVVEDTRQPLKRYDPGHPDADASGYVSYPDINPLTEMVDLMGATRSYGLNSSAVQAEKGMIGSALEIAKG